MAFRTFADLAEAMAYADSLDTRWPERAAVREHVSHNINAVPGTHIVEFCAGAGALAQQLFADYPHIQYTGIDVTAPLLEIARQRLADHADQITWVQADLNEDGWLRQIKRPINAFVSMQSLHDLGDEAAVARIMRLAERNLAAQGQFVYADMLAPEPPQENNNPGKLSVARHLDLLHEAGFATAACTWTTGVFGCFLAKNA